MGVVLVHEDHRNPALLLLQGNKKGPLWGPSLGFVKPEVL
jgi:hypothetical protein